MADRIRLTITVTPEVHAVFSRMAETAGLSLGKCMGDWLEDTMEGAQFVAQKMDDAKRAPKVVMRELQALSKGFSEEVDSLAKQIRQGRPADGAVRQPQAGAGGAAAAGLFAPASNTGGKPPTKTPKPRGQA